MVLPDQMELNAHIFNSCKEQRLDEDDRELKDCREIKEEKEYENAWLHGHWVLWKGIYSKVLKATHMKGKVLKNEWM